MKQFSLEEFKKNPNRKVVTRSGLQVRILCADKKGEYPVVALVENSDNTEDVHSFRENGLLCKSYKTNADLFFDTEKKEAWLNLHRNDMGFIMPGYLYDTEEQAIKEISDKSHHVATIKITWEE